MTDTMTKLELNSFLADTAPDEQATLRRAPWQMAGLLLVVLAILSYFLGDYALETRKHEILIELEKRLEVSASGRADVIETWMATAVQPANRIAENELFKLFASEVNLSTDGQLSGSLREQIPYMQNVITSFVNENDLIGAYLIGKDGRAYLASGGAPALEEDQRLAAQQQYENDGAGITPFRVLDIGLAFDFLVPISAAQSTTPGSDGSPVGMLLMTVPASEPLTEFLTATPVTGGLDTARLFQLTSSGLYELDPTEPPFIARAPSEDITAADIGFTTLFARNGAEVYSVGTAVQGTDLFLFQQISADEALAGLKTYGYFIAAIAGGGIVIILSLFTAIWLMMDNQKTRELASQYKNFATQINVQRRLLGSINNTIDEQIGLTDPEGHYIYANPSLARLVDVPLRSIPGKTDRELYGEKPARELAENDRKAIATEQTVNSFIEVETVHGTRILRVAKSRFLNEDGLFMGIVTVSTDITEYVEYQRRKEEMDQKTITVLARMLEANDPYLADHAGRMGKLASYISSHLGLSEETQRIIETGASLSQVGKISIPREIRVKETRLTEGEQKIMQEHVLVAEKILTEAEIEKPVLDAVTQINESLDGTGYPNGLQDDEIEIPARILGMADILIARISPRAYRKTIGIDEALRVFSSNPEKYDPKIVQAMIEFFETEEGQTFKEEIELHAL
ncbi:MAG: PAS domain-containing protein [Proteobacteria bacterium]|nr:PAS domain-containing protein [Pseudomonadota bacterium]